MLAYYLFCVLIRGGSVFKDVAVSSTIQGSKRRCVQQDESADEKYLPHKRDHGTQQQADAPLLRATRVYQALKPLGAASHNKWRWLYSWAIPMLEQSRQFLFAMSSLMEVRELGPTYYHTFFGCHPDLWGVLIEWTISGIHAKSDAPPSDLQRGSVNGSTSQQTCERYLSSPTNETHWVLLQLLLVTFFYPPLQHSTGPHADSTLVSNALPIYCNNRWAQNDWFRHRCLYPRLK